MDLKQEIEFYGNDIQDYQTSPFEMIETFHLRTKFHHHYDKLDNDEKASLKKCDQLLLRTVEKVYNHVSSIYDFKNDKPIGEWWWHLDKVLDRKLLIDIENGIVTQTYLSTIVDFASKEEYNLFLNWSQDKQIVIREKGLKY